MRTSSRRRIWPVWRIKHRMKMRTLRFFSLALLAVAVAPITAQQSQDTDHDGLNDALEQRLLVQFAPDFQIGDHDCSNIPASFTPDLIQPVVAAEDATIYGQVFLSPSSTKDRPSVEIHYYHLWRIDCGRHGHPLDTEHVSTLIHADSADLDSAKWHADYWFAAAHEDTVCDVSQITRAATLHAEDHGPKVWISPGKHASYLNETLCKAGCGADRCLQMAPLHMQRIVNLGEPGAPMNGSLFVSSKEWPLAEKMSASNFAAEPLSRLNALPPTDIAWYVPGRHPAQGVIAISSHTEEHIADAGNSTGAALNTANDDTGAAISVATGSTGNALQKSYRKTVHALGKAAKNIGKALPLTDKDDKPEPQK
jgi:hypothetical protein